MSSLDLKALNLTELKKLQREVNSAVENFEYNKKLEALKDLEARAREHGYSLAELVSEVPKKPARAAKYRNPETGQEWSGRGRKPTWVLEARTKGISLATFEIKET